jgi:hypothetical protein
MKIMVSVLGLVLAVCCSTVQAEDKQPSKQQLRMKACNQQAREQTLKGDARKSFMKQCLSGKTEISEPPAAGSATAGTCAQRADEQKLKGKARKQFLADCKE